MTNEEKLKAIRKIVTGADTAVIRYYEEDFDPSDHSGGNFDDAWAGGMYDGNIEVAKEILEILND